MCNARRSFFPRFIYIFIGVLIQYIIINRIAKNINKKNINKNSKKKILFAGCFFLTKTEFRYTIYLTIIILLF